MLHWDNFTMLLVMVGGPEVPLMTFSCHRLNINGFGVAPRLTPSIDTAKGKEEMDEVLVTSSAIP